MYMLDIQLVHAGCKRDFTTLTLFPLLQNQIDTVIMGCTHYPALRLGISKVAGPNIALVDSAEVISKSIMEDIAAARLHAAPTENPLAGQLKIMTTDVSPSFTDVATRLMRPRAIPELLLVDIGTIVTK